MKRRTITAEEARSIHPDGIRAYVSESGCYLHAADVAHYLRTTDTDAISKLVLPNVAAWIERTAVRLGGPETEGGER